MHRELIDKASICHLVLPEIVQDGLRVGGFSGFILELLCLDFKKGRGRGGGGGDEARGRRWNIILDLALPAHS